MQIMTCSIEKILGDAKLLVNRLKDHDTSADTLISQSHCLKNRIEAMKQYQEDMNELNEMARHRPRSALILGLAQENSQIRELQQENRELRMSLEEHQSAIELIMSKYREQILKLIMTNKMQQSQASSADEKDVGQLIDKVCEMAVVMQKSVKVDDDNYMKDQEKITKLQLENEGLRQLLEISTTTQKRIVRDDQDDKDTQTTDSLEAQEKDKDAQEKEVQEKDKDAQEKEAQEKEVQDKPKE